MLPHPNNINAAHCEKTGAILADIHITDFSELGIPNHRPVNPQPVDWNSYLERGYVNKTVRTDSLKEVIEELYDWNARGNKAAGLLSSDMDISHRDMDPKNVMWNEDKPLVIDWESAGFINPMHELIETALYWSENERGNIDKERFPAFIDVHKGKAGYLVSNWRMVLDNGFSGKFEWLEYNLKISLWIECLDAEEQRLGTAQVEEQ